MNTFYYIDKDKNIKSINTVKDADFLKQHQNITAYNSIDDIELPAGYRLSDDNTAIQAKTYSEKFEDGELTLETFIEIVRSKRDSLLNECDLKYCNAQKWSVMDEDTQTLWTTYKQTLRDLPANITKVSDSIDDLFPAIPE